MGAPDAGNPQYISWDGAIGANFLRRLHRLFFALGPRAPLTFRPFCSIIIKVMEEKIMKIIKLTTENLASNCVTDNANPRFSFAISSDRRGAALKEAVLSVGDWKTVTKDQILIPYAGKELKPFTEYEVTVSATDTFGETDTARMRFTTGRLKTPWKGKWISDAGYVFTEKGVSPVPMFFKKGIRIAKPVARAVVYATAMGIYRLELNGKRVGEDYFTPGFTSYKTNLQYQTYDVTALLGEENELLATVAGGWAVGSFVFTRKNRISADRQALLLELRIAYTDGTEEVIGTDETWDVTEDGQVRMADIYDGETYDATVDLGAAQWRKAAFETLRVDPKIEAAYGAPVRAHEELLPVSCTRLASGELVYDFGQNFAGVIKATLMGKKGQIVTFRHAEILNADGTLNTALLRSAKATATYTCTDGEQTYSPTLTYMGFRYVGVTGIEEHEIKLSALALYSDVPANGTFECSDALVNKLQKNITWGAKSNFVDIPTDCPQRDERMGWTGDIALFAPTACYNFDLSRFLDKWLRDLRAEQLKSGGLPNTIPVQGYGFPATMPEMAVAFWGDACGLVPWAEYLARGDRKLLEDAYESVKKYVKACGFWAKLWGVGKYRYIWHIHHMFQFGDWVAPDEPTMAGWQKRSKWTATASYANMARLVSEMAKVLGKPEDEKKYRALYEKISDAYMSVFTDGNGKLKTEFQTAYVLPLHFRMFPKAVRAKAAENLAALVKRNGYKIGTGFPGTPFILFALADNGQEETAFRMLMNTACPSWLYEVKAGGTTVWERWDGLKEDGTLNAGEGDGTGGMISFNHYASGAVGDFLYKRVLGIEPMSCGYKTFRVKPLVGGGLTSASGTVETPYGTASASWKKEEGTFALDVTVPAGTTCEVTLPDGTVSEIGSGKYSFSCNLS